LRPFGSSALKKRPDLAKKINVVIK